MTLFVTPSQVETAMLATGKTWFPIRCCGGCNAPIGYVLDRVDGRWVPFFDPSCDCCSGDGPEMRDWSDIADWINMQDTDEARREVAALFSVTLSRVTLSPSSL